MMRRSKLRAGSGMRWARCSSRSTSLTYSAPGAALKQLASTGDARLNRRWTLMGVPCVNVPAFVADGGNGAADAQALAAARSVEKARKSEASLLADASGARLQPLGYFRGARRTPARSARRTATP